MFPDLLGPAPTFAPGGPFDIERIGAQFRAITLPDARSLLPGWSGQIVASSATVAKANRARLGRRALGVLALLGAVAGFVGMPSLAIVWIGIGIFGLVKFFGGSVEQAPFRKAYTDADARARSLEQAFIDRLGLAELLAVRIDVESWINAYRELDRDMANDLQRLKTSREARKRDEFLDRFLIRRARIAGIGPAKTATLASYGIETAADIKANAVRAVPGFGKAMAAKLVAWRKIHEDKFRYNAVPDASDVQAENAVRANWAAKRIDLQAKIRSGVSALQTGPQQIATRARVSDPALIDALGRRAQAEHDLKALGIPVPPSNAANAPGIRPSSTPKPSSGSTPPMTQTTSSLPTCPQCGSPMRRRTARKGRRAGRQFWGCSRYPSCRGTRS
jgi:hypothetical protein